MFPFVAWTQLVSTKHGVSWDFLGSTAKALASDTAPKQKCTSPLAALAANTSATNLVSNRPPPLEGRFDALPTDPHSLATTAETRAFHLSPFKFFSFLFYSRLLSSVYSWG